MPEPAYDCNFWDQLWSKTLRDNPGSVDRRPPNQVLTRAAASLRPGIALDAGCGHGSEALWLAAHGWGVEAVDFSAAALAQGRRMAEAAGGEIAARIEWIEADLGSWKPQPSRYDLVASIYVHVAGSVEDAVGRLAASVVPGGDLLLIGHAPVDPESGAATAAAGQRQVSVAAATAALDPDDWKLLIAEDRPRSQAGSGVDAVIQARRLR